jgi:hypothetical protein
MRAVFAEEPLGALGNGQEAHGSLLRLDDAAFPFGEFDAERLREAADDVIDEREAPLGLGAGRALLVVLLEGRLHFRASAAHRGQGARRGERHVAEEARDGLRHDPSLLCLRAPLDQHL